VKLLGAFGLIGVQLLGAALAGGLLRLVFSFDEVALTNARLGVPHLHLGQFESAGITRGTSLAGIGMEIGLTLILTFVILALLLDVRASRWLGPGAKRWGCLFAGLTVAAATVAGFPFTGAALNPARWFGPVMWEFTVPALQLQQPMRDHIVYWFGPTVGALLAGGVYLTWIMPAEEAPTTAPPPASGAKAAAGSKATLFRSK
jgi:glycerol uptake facilitator-like aquaporin